MERKEYWYCIIGPSSGTKVNNASDGELRKTIRDKFMEVFGQDSEVCSSGWGMTESTRDLVTKINRLNDKAAVVKVEKILNRSYEDSTIIDYYKMGFNDERTGKTSDVSDSELYNTAYSLGAKIASLSSEPLGDITGNNRTLIIMKVRGE